MSLEGGNSLGNVLRTDQLSTSTLCELLNNFASESNKTFGMYLIIYSNIINNFHTTSDQIQTVQIMKLSIN